MIFLLLCSHQLEVRLSQKESQLQEQPQSRKSDSSSWEQYIDVSTISVTIIYLC